MNSIDWAPIIVFGPGIVVGFTTGVYNFFVPGSKPKPKTLDEYSPGEIGLVIGGVVILCGVLAGGFIILNFFEPVSKIICYLYYFIMSLSLVSIFLIDYFRRHKKGPLFCFLIYLIAQLPCLTAYAVIYHNGAADTALAQKIEVKMVSPEPNTNWGKPHEVMVKSTDPSAGFFQIPTRLDVSLKIAKGLTKVQSMDVVLKPGALGIPWIEKMILNDVSNVQKAKISSKILE